jgi:hypothetical protein
MTPAQLLTDALQKLPPPVRATLYTLLGVAGVGLAVCSMSGVDKLGPLTITGALQIYAFLSAATGGVAVANVHPRRRRHHAELTSFDEDVDLSSFEPVGLASDVYGEVPA